MNNKETIKVLKRMLSPDLEADEYYAIKTAIKEMELSESLQKTVVKLTKIIEVLGCTNELKQKRAL
jgi:hypothetical protein